MEALRDPIWQFVGVVVAVLALGVPGLVWLLRRRSAAASRQRNEEIINQMKQHWPAGTQFNSGKHKKRKKDGILLANLSSDFLNQFPLPVAVLAAHLDWLYTPENFGGPDWLTVFRRLTAEGYFETADGRSPRRITIESLLNPGHKSQSWFRDASQLKRRIAGLDDEPENQGG
jgi:hypothetical protein